MCSRKWFAFVGLLVAALCVAITTGHMNCTAINATQTLCTVANGTSFGGGGRGRGRGRRWIGEMLVLANNEKRLQQNTDGEAVDD